MILDLNEVLFEFSNKERYNVFKSLYNQNKRHSQLEKELNIPGSEISRHLKRLFKKNLISKSANNIYEVTNIGKIFLQIMNIFEVSLYHKDFLNTHEITDVPVHLILQLGKLKSIEVSNKTLENVELWSNLVKNSEKFIYAISDQFQISLLPIIEKKIKTQSIKVKALVDKSLLKSYNIPSEWSQKFQDPIVFYKKLQIYQNIRILKKINLSLIASDKGAILFLSKVGQIDYSHCLIDNNESFINWTTELFEWYWKKGKNLKPFIKKEIQSMK